MWTKEQRARHAPRGRRYPSDLTDAEWALIAPFIPPPCSGGRGRKTAMREVMNAILYVLASGCQWRALPKDFPPRRLRLLLGLAPLWRARPHPS